MNKNINHRDNPRIDTANFHYNVGADLLRLKFYEDAIDKLTKAIELEPNERYYDRRGIAYGEEYDYDNAIMDFSRALSLNDSFAPAYNNRGLCFYKLDKMPEAIADYNRAIELMPNIATFHANLALALYVEGYDEDAKEEYDKAIRLDRDFTDAYAYRAEYFIQKKRYKEAIRDLKIAVRIEEKMKTEGLDKNA